MKRGFLCLMFVALTVSGLVADESEVLPTLVPVVKEVVSAVETVPNERRAVLDQVAAFIAGKVAAKETAELTFICTHNSRRSHLTQIWAQTAAAYYGVDGVKTYSGGTEATACNERTVASLQRLGFEVDNTTPAQENPVYQVKYSLNQSPLKAFSKVYSHESNPKSGFVAVLTCDSADKGCPVVRGSALRVPIPYVDPKVSDGTDQEAATYDERSKQIAREMFYLMSQVNVEGKRDETD